VLGQTVNHSIYISCIVSEICETVPDFLDPIVNSIRGDREEFFTKTICARKLEFVESLEHRVHLQRRLRDEPNIVTDRRTDRRQRYSGIVRS